MPFKSRSQVRACYAKKSRGQAKGWNCDEWAGKTKSIKKLPEKKASDYNAIIITSFTKIAKELFNPEKSPIIKRDVIEARKTSGAVQNSIARRVKNVQDRKSQINKTAGFKLIWGQSSQTRK